jgi:diketogulonate reductase-like aldo/keto reductase
VISATSPTLTLNNGVEMPALGFGVFQTPPAETVGAVETAIREGYRLIDTAAAYMNEREVSEGIRRAGIARSEIFVETKLWISDYGYDAALHAFDKSARKLGVDQIDLLLLHHPLSSDFDRTLDAYRALETLLAAGKVRAIGLSNFMPGHLNHLLAETSVVPAVNQIEVHPYFQQTASQRQGRSAIPKSTKPARIAENFYVFDFELDSDELKAIVALDTSPACAAALTPTASRSWRTA